MIRAVVFFVVVAALAFATAWFAERPGGVEIVWLGYRITTSVAVLAAAIAALVVVMMLVWWLLAAIWRSPARWSRYLRMRRAARGQRAISRGLIAIGAGDLRAAKKFSDEARRFAAGEPLTLLLGAQSAQLAGDRAAAERTFGAMVARADLKLIGLHGLYIEAQRRGDAAAARALAEQAAAAAPSLAWAANAVLEFRCANGEWREALAALERSYASDLIAKPTYRRQRAVLLTAHARDIAASDRDGARQAALDAVKLAPDLVPAAALAGRFLAEAGELRKAARIIEAAWRANPHPDLAEAYINLKSGDSARERLARAQRLAKQPAGHVEGALALARAALEASEFAQARAALAPLVAAPTQRVAMLMAEIEEGESGDVGRARAWMARAVRAAPDPVWTADGYVSEEWLPVSPGTGRLDAFEWRVAVAALPGAVIDVSSQPGATAKLGTRDETRTIEASIPETPKAAADEIPPSDRGANETAPPPATTQPVAARPAQSPPVVETVIPLVHAPDDPGPEPAESDEPVVTPKADNWQRLRTFFR